MAPRVDFGITIARDAARDLARFDVFFRNSEAGPELLPDAFKDLR
jgi:hypothetical protein